MTKAQFEQALSQYLPPSALTMVVELLFDQPISLKITKNRSTKYGDYRPPLRSHGHRISVNGDLNPYAFLVTLIHEYAHYVVHTKYSRNVSPHGKEWKFAFQQEMKPFLNRDIFPEQLLLVLEQHMLNPKASSASDQRLRKALMEFDTKKKTLLEDLPEKAVFMIAKKGVYRKGEKKRTRYLCQEVQSKKWFFVHGLAEVEHLKN